MCYLLAIPHIDANVLGMILGTWAARSSKVLFLALLLGFIHSSFCNHSDHFNLELNLLPARSVLLGCRCLKRDAFFHVLCSPAALVLFGSFNMLRFFISQDLCVVSLPGKGLFILQLSLNSALREVRPDSAVAVCLIPHTDRVFCLTPASFPL